jgi:hypothetical protein
MGNAILHGGLSSLNLTFIPGRYLYSPRSQTLIGFNSYSLRTGQEEGLTPAFATAGQAALPDLFQTLKSLDADCDRMTLATSRVTQDIIFVRPLILCESIY